MCKFCDDADKSTGSTGSKKAALGLLMAMSLLHESRTPVSLFRQSPSDLRCAWEQTHHSKLLGYTPAMKGKTGNDTANGGLGETACESSVTVAATSSRRIGGVSPFEDLFSGTKVKVFECARDVLKHFGFLRAGPGLHVGGMHQLIQRAVRDSVVIKTPDSVTIHPKSGLQLVETLESILLHQYNYNTSRKWDQKEMTRVQRLSPCIERWCVVFWPLNERNKEFTRCLGGPCRVHASCTLRQTLGHLLLEVEGSPLDSLSQFQSVLTVRKRLYPKGDHPHIANSMNNVARTLGALGKHQQALKMQEDVLAMYKRLYPKGDHPDIATSMNTVAATLHALGKHQQALKMFKDALGMLRLSLPPSHPSIRTCIKNTIVCKKCVEQSEKQLTAAAKRDKKRKKRLKKQKTRNNPRGKGKKKK